jgi:hypothetical protein
MGYIVTAEGPMDDLDYQSYLAALTSTLLRRGTPPERVPRVLENGTPERWVYVWDDEAEARAFVEQLRERFDGPPWQVREAHEQPSVGPLAPLQLNVGPLATGWAFELDVMSRAALKRRYPHTCRQGTVVVRLYPGERPQEGDLARLASQVLPILTGLGEEELAPFGSYQVIRRSTGALLVPPVPLQAREAGPPVPVAASGS